MTYGVTLIFVCKMRFAKHLKKVLHVNIRTYQLFAKNLRLRPQVKVNDINRFISSPLTVLVVTLQCMYCVVDINYKSSTYSIHQLTLKLRIMAFTSLCLLFSPSLGVILTQFMLHLNIIMYKSLFPRNFILVSYNRSLES